MMLAPADPHEVAEIGAMMTKLAAIFGPSWSDVQRKEWIKTTTALIADLPVFFVARVLRDLPYKVDYANQVVKWVSDRIAPTVEAVRKEQDTLTRAIGLLERISDRRPEQLA